MPGTGEGLRSSAQGEGAAAADAHRSPDRGENRASFSCTRRCPRTSGRVDHQRATVAPAQPLRHLDRGDHVGAGRSPRRGPLAREARAISFASSVARAGRRPQAGSRAAACSRSGRPRSCAAPPRPRPAPAIRWAPRRRSARRACPLPHRGHAASERPCPRLDEGVDRPSVWLQSPRPGRGSRRCCRVVELVGPAGVRLPAQHARGLDMSRVACGWCARPRWGRGSAPAPSAAIWVQLLAGEGV